MIYTPVIKVLNQQVWKIFYLLIVHPAGCRRVGFGEFMYYDRKKAEKQVVY